MIWRAGTKVKMDYEFIDDAFNMEAKTKQENEKEEGEFEQRISCCSV